MRRRMFRTAFAGVMVLTLVGLTGCLTAVREVTGRALEDRSHADLRKDTELASHLVSRLQQRYEGRDLEIRFDVWEQRVLVTGTVRDPGVKAELGALVKDAPRVRAVYNEAQVVTPDREAAPSTSGRQEERKTDEGGLQETIDDAWISKKIEAQLLADPEVRSVNYRWRVVRNTVYLIGTARSQTELDRMLELSRATKGVREVKHFIEVKPG